MKWPKARHARVSDETDFRAYPYSDQHGRHVLSWFRPAEDHHCMITYHGGGPSHRK